jgi:hypothetical protein
MTNTCQYYISKVGIAGTHNRACMAIVGDLRSILSGYAVVDEDFGIGANANEVAPGG